MELDQRWTLFKEHIEKQLEPEDYEAWLDDLEFVEISSRRIAIAGIPHPLFRDDIYKNYDGLFRTLLDKVFPEKAPFQRKKIEYRVGAYSHDKKENVQTEFTFEGMTQNEVIESQKRRSKKGPTQKSSDEPKVVTFQKVTPVELENALFNPKYSLDNFVTGDHNQLAHGAACRIIHEAGALYNPFFVYGGLGLGKTHLLEALGQGIQKVHPDWKVLYTTAETFLNDFILHLQQHKMAQFRERYRKVDVFILDDLQVLGGAKSCQEELLNTINSLSQCSKQVIIASQKLPKDIKTLNDGLSSRLESGLMADLHTPDLEGRMAILQGKASRDHIMLPPEVCYFVAQHIYSDVRKMEGALIRLGAHASLLRQKITLPLAKKTLADLVELVPDIPRESEEAVPVDRIEKVFEKICSLSQVSRKDLKSNRRDSKVVRARQMSMYLLKELTDLSLSEIGAQFGDRTHSAIHAALKKVRKKMESDEVLQRQLLSIKADLSQVTPVKVTPLRAVAK